MRLFSFHSAAAFEATLPRHDPRPLILRMRDIRHIDSSGLITLEAVIEHRHRSGGDTILTDVRPDVASALRRFGIADLVLDPALDQTTEGAFGSLERLPTSSSARASESVSLGPEARKPLN